MTVTHHYYPNDYNSKINKNPHKNNFRREIPQQIPNFISRNPYFFLQENPKSLNLQKNPLNPNNLLQYFKQNLTLIDKKHYITLIFLKKNHIQKHKKV